MACFWFMCDTVMFTEEHSTVLDVWSDSWQVVNISKNAAASLSYHQFRDVLHTGACLTSCSRRLWLEVLLPPWSGYSGYSSNKATDINKNVQKKKETWCVLWAVLYWLVAFFGSLNKCVRGLSLEARLKASHLYCHGRWQDPLLG